MQSGEAHAQRVGIIGTIKLAERLATPSSSGQCVPANAPVALMHSPQAAPPGPGIWKPSPLPPFPYLPPLLSTEPYRPDVTQKLALDDIAALKIRPARIVASALNIKQKANGIDKSLGQLRQEIKLCLQHEAELVVQALQLVKVG